MVKQTRIGIVDMGSNAIRFMIAEASGREHRIVESHRLAVRLGTPVFQSGMIPDATIADIVDAFRRFRTSCDHQGAKLRRAIATSAMRSARNRDLLVDRVRQASGFEIDVISGTQEAYLLKLAVETKLDLSQGRSVLIDVGGGSAEVVVVDDGAIASANSYRLGALRMLEQFKDADEEDFVDLMKKHLGGLDHRIAESLDDGKIDRYVTVGGNIESLADLVTEQVGHRQKNDIDACSISDLNDVVRELAEMSVDERIERHRLRADRADAIVPAGLLYAHLGELTRSKHALVPRVGVKEGLLVEVIQGRSKSFAAEDHVDVALGSCRALGKRFHYEAEHAETVLRLARQLFDQTIELHGLGDRARVLLEAAALLHDIGAAINIDGHHKHSQYLIESTEIVGLGSYERHLVAILARYHRKAAPSRDHDDFMALRRRDRSMIERLAALLRLADALDRQHAGVIRSVEVSIQDQQLSLLPTLTPDDSTRLTLEATAVTHKGALFNNLFGLTPVLLAP
ncbi:MAG: Ppx/GppA phosphatase family protein [Myxococcota bacterium]|nr:Ppx/GppA phosphatase family protein [Myxococcota bacterium]